MATDKNDIDFCKTYKLDVVSFNMHGFYQGLPAIYEIIEKFNPGVILLQETWLTPANLCKFDQFFHNYFHFGCSSMSHVVETGPLRGRPFGGIMCMINNDLRTFTETIHCAERYAILRLFNYLIINVYFPCAGTLDRELICDDMLAEIDSWCDQYDSCELIIAGDWNVELNCHSSGHVTVAINSFFEKHHIVRCDSLFPDLKAATYINVTLNHSSTIDYIASSVHSLLTDFSVLDFSSNLSDHLPILASFNLAIHEPGKKEHLECAGRKENIVRFRWDKADILSYYSSTGALMQPILSELDKFEICKLEASRDAHEQFIEEIYDRLINIMLSCASSYVPRCYMNSFKFWWDEELDLLKEASISSDRLWKAVGRPRNGNIFNERQQCRRRYKHCYKEHQRAAAETYTNELHEALLKKDGLTFWKCWRSKFSSTQTCNQVDGYVDPLVITQKFMEHFSSICSNTEDDHSKDLKDEFLNAREHYAGVPLTSEKTFDVELVSHIIDQLKRGKAAGLDNITAEHLQYSHPALPCILTRLFNLMFECCYVPKSFGYSYIVPLPKLKDFYSKRLTVNDFRGIAISCLLSKLYEMCIYDRFNEFLFSANNQFGFKKGSGCRHAIYTLRKVVENFVSGGSTVNLCSIDLSKAFDTVNHYALFIKLMKRHVPVNLLDTLTHWFDHSFSCVKWHSVFSDFFKLNLGVRQGSVLSPHLFAVYLDDVTDLAPFGQRFSIIIYADDILLISPSLSALQDLLHKCESELKWLGMTVNAKKSCCLRIGQRCNVPCANIKKLDGLEIPWVTEFRYLGVFIVQSRRFQCSIHHHKKAFFRSVNAILGKLGGVATENVILQLVYSKCMPVLLYGLECFDLRPAEMNSLDFTFRRFLFKLFHTADIYIVNYCCEIFDIELPKQTLERRYVKFIGNFDVI